MTKRYMKRVLNVNITIIRKMQIKTTMRYHLTSVRITINKKKKKDKYIEKRGALYTAGGNINWCGH